MNKSAVFFLSSILLFSLWTLLAIYTAALIPIDQWFDDHVARRGSLYWINANSIVSIFGRASLIIPLSLFISIFLFSKKYFKEAFWYLLAIHLGLLLNFSLKVLIGRERPVFLGWHITETTLSYPSGHTTGAFVFYGLTAYLLLKMGPTLFERSKGIILSAASLLIFLIGLSRIVLGVHWFSDVMGGWLLGASWVFLSRMIIRRFG